MDISGSVLVQGHRFEQNVVTSCVLGNFRMQIDNLVDLFTNLKRVWVHLFADLTLEALPVVGADVHVCGTWSLELLLSENPVFEALEVNYANRTFAFTGENQWIMVIIFGAPADSALHVILVLINVFGAFDLHGFSKLLVVELILRHLDLIAPEVLNSESDSSKLDGVKLLYFVVVLASFVFERSSNKPKSVD